MSYHARASDLVRNQRVYAQEIADFAVEELVRSPSSIGILLCEGDSNSIDEKVYSAIFPDLLIVPVGSCCNVMRLLPRVRRILAVDKIYAFGIIDRDALSKSEIKKFQRASGVSTTKLPFIENIICTPEVIQCVCEELDLDYVSVIEKINKQMMNALWQRLKETLPINLGISKNERIEVLKIGASTKKKTIEKQVDNHNILYAYRSKVIVSIVASEMHMRNREAYYAKIGQMLESECYRAKLVKIMSAYLHKFVLYDFEKL